MRRGFLIIISAVFLLGGIYPFTANAGWLDKMKKGAEELGKVLDNKEEPKQPPQLPSTRKEDEQKGINISNPQPEAPAKADRASKKKSVPKKPVTLSKPSGDSIQPFSSLSWQDSLVEVLSKIHGIEGVEKINLIVGPPDKISVKGISTKKRLEKELNAVSNATEPGTTFYKLALLSDNQLSLENYEELGKQVLDSGPFVVEAFPIIIANIPFTLYIVFTNCAGLLVESPEKAIMLKSPQYGNYYIPLIIGQVILTSDLQIPGENLGANEDFVKLKGIVKQKYESFLSKKDARISDDKDVFQLEIKDKEGSVFKMVASRYTNKCKIIYQSTAHESKLKKSYSTYLSEFKKNKYKNKKDMGSAL